MGYPLKNYWKQLKNFKKINNKKKYIKVLVMDVDGTLTDGSINIAQNGELYKKFYCRDGLAIIDAQKKGITPVILTSRISEIVKRRAEELGIKQIHQGFVDDKKTQLQHIAVKLEVELDEVAYIGDDRNDLESMKICGLVGCPGNAIKEVKKEADYICKHVGGDGAVREFIDWLLD